MQLSLGYLKDCLAFIGFIFCFIIIYLIDDLNKIRIIILIIIFLAILVDGTFTFIPKMHNANVNITKP